MTRNANSWRWCAAAIAAGVVLLPAAGRAQDVDPAMAEFQRRMEEGPKGTLAVRAVQGTANGPAVGGEEVEVVLFHRNMAVRQYKEKMDGNGLLMLNDLPVGIEFSPLVRIKHAGVLYQEAGPVMSAEKPKASMDVLVYEVTETMPAWKVVMRHVMAAKTPAGADVSETITVENPADQTWLGAPADAEGRRATVTLSLPAKASEINLEQGFHGWCCTAYQSPQLSIQMPLMPGRMTYKLSYRVPAESGATDLRVSVPASISHAAFFVAADGASIEPTGLVEGPMERSGGLVSKMFQADQVGPGQTMGVVLVSGASTPVPTGAAPASAGVPAWVWIGGGAAAAVIAVFVVLAGRKGANAA